MMNFVLVGYDSPTGSYPSPVAPVGEGEAGLVVAYRSGDKVEVESIAAEAEFARHVMDDFNVERDALFAFSSDDVVRYAFEDEALFFEAVLQDPRMTDADAFFRLAIAMETGHADLISRELADARSRMTENAPHYAAAWYASTLDRLGGDWRSAPDGLVLLERAQWPASPRSILAPVFFAERQFEREALKLREVLDRSSGNGAREKLERLRVRCAADVTVAVSWQQMTEVGAYLDIPGTRIWWNEAPAVEMVDLLVIAEPSNAGRWPSNAVYHSLQPTINVPMLATQPSWAARLDSGMAGFEGRVAEAIRNLVRVPRLRDGLVQATDIGATHLKNLGAQHDLLREQMSVAEENVRARFRSESEVHERTLSFGVHCLRMVTDEIASWRPPKIWRSAARMEKEVSELARRCEAIVEHEVRAWRRSVTRAWGGVHGLSDVGIESNFLEEVFVPVVPMAAALTALPLSSPVLASGLRGELIKRALTDVARHQIRVMIEAMTEFLYNAGAGMRVEVERLMKEPFDRSRQTDELIGETVGCMRRLRRLEDCLDTGAVM